MLNFNLISQPLTIMGFVHVMFICHYFVSIAACDFIIVDDCLKFQSCLLSGFHLHGILISSFIMKIRESYIKANNNWKEASSKFPKPNIWGCTSKLLESVLNQSPISILNSNDTFFLEVVGFLPGYLRSSAIIVCLVSLMVVLAIFFICLMHLCSWQLPYHCFIPPTQKKK